MGTVDLIDFEILCEEHGQEKYADMPAGRIERYAGQVPEELLAIWRQYGLTSHGQGEVWFTNPEDYTEIVQAFFGREQPFLVFARTSFGHLKAILRGQLYTILPQIALAQHGHDVRIFPTLVSSGLIRPHSEAHAEHQRALQALGPLTSRQMYGYVPMLALGGEGTLEENQVVPLQEYLLMVAGVATQAVREGWDPLGRKHTSET
ncbi:GAD-like domain-containing protein [Deinococcus hohokamensis]|uniref:GAD-like domain-containing protein n=1 Tax=Deinococcus hohokamensis TaxID=309883 RepID=A0ABV9I783_9DEIO